MKPIETKYACIALADTRQGGRSENQDTCAWCDTPHGLLITVCDGMGGGPSGKTASVTAANRLLQYVMDCPPPCEDRRKLLVDAISAANQDVFQMGQENPLLNGMGTTVTAILFNEESAVVAHVGDSRVYQFRHGKKVFRTWDHSRVFEGLKTGMFKTEEECRIAPGSNIILRAVGTSDHVKVDVIELPYEKGDRFMLCTDGIWGAFPESEIITMAAKTAYLAGAVESLVVRVDETGMQNGGHHDNLTVAMLETKNDSILKEKMSTKHKRILIALGALCTASLLVNVFLVSSRSAIGKTQGKASGTSVDVKRIIDSLESVNERNIEELEARLEEKQNKMMEELKSKIATKNEDAIRDIFDTYEETQETRLELDNLIQELSELKTMKAGDEKNKRVDAVCDTFNKLSSRNGLKDKKMVAIVKERLSNGIMKKDDAKDPSRKVLGHYGEIISMIQNLKQEL